MGLESPNDKTDQYICKSQHMINKNATLVAKPNDKTNQFICNNQHMVNKKCSTGLKSKRLNPYVHL